MKRRKKVKFEPKLRTIENKLWALCRELCLRRDIKNGKIDCYTCSQKNLKGINCQLGHGYPKGALGAILRFDLRLLKYQCYNCNINLGGMGQVFWKNLEQDMGKLEADLLFAECKRSKGTPVKARPFYLALIEVYKDLLKT